MLTMIRDTNRFTFPITPAEIQITSSNEIDSFVVITGEEKTSKRLTSKLKRVSFSVIFPRSWEELWETGKETVAYQSPEQAWKLMEEWKAKPVVINFESLFSQTMWFESFEATYKDGQANLHINFNFVEFDPVKIVSYSNTKQLLKPGVIITKSSKSRPNTSGKTDSKNEKEKSDKQKKAEEKTAADNKVGDFDYLAQKERILTKNNGAK